MGLELTDDDIENLRDIAHRVGMRILSVTGGFEIDDVKQATIEDLLRVMKTTEIRSPEAWVTVVARRRAMDYRDRREQWRKMREPLNDEPGGDAPHYMRDPYPRVDAEMDMEAMSAVVRQAVAGLPDNLRAVIEVSEFRDPPLRGPTAADELAIAYGTYRNRRSEAIGLLSKSVLDLLGTPRFGE
jgi:RNA polymerase sigma factor (sigma-70 family)